MPKGVLYVETRPVSPEREDEYNAWYDGTHLPEVVALPGVTAARRYKSADGAYVALYDLDLDDLSTITATLGAAIGDGSVQMTDSMQMDPPPVMRVLEQTTSHP